MFIDIDEFMIPLEKETLQTFLKDFEKFGGVEIDMIKYGSGGAINKTEGLVIERFKSHDSYHDYLEIGHVKSIINPRRAFSMDNSHLGLYFFGEYAVNSDEEKNKNGLLKRRPKYDKIRYNHYMTKSFEEFSKRMKQPRASSSGNLTLDDFKLRDRNEIKNDTTMDKYIQNVKINLKHRLG